MREDKGKTLQRKTEVSQKKSLIGYSGRIDLFGLSWSKVPRYASVDWLCWLLIEYTLASFSYTTDIYKK